MPLVEIIGGGILPFTAPSAGGPVLTNLVAWYEFDEGEGQVLTDYSGNGNHGQLGSTAGEDTNDPAWVTEGLSFDGSDDFVAIPTHNFTGALTISLVYRYTSAAAQGRPLGASTGDVHGLIVFTNGLLGVRVLPGGSLDSTQPLPAINVWECVTFRRDADGKADLFRNGGAPVRLFSDAAQAGTTFFDRLGSRSSGTNPLAGGEAAALFYDAALSDADIQGQNYDYLQSLVAPRGITLP